MTGGAPIRKTVSVTADTSVDLEAPPARLAGAIVEVGTGRPLGDAEVRIEEHGRSFMGMSATKSDSNGRFALEDLEPKAYRVAVQKAAYQTETKTLTAADPSGDVVIELKRGEGIGVVAKDGVYGVPLRSLSVRVLAPAASPSTPAGSPSTARAAGKSPRCARAATRFARTRKATRR
jgi:hypothetical protein